MTALGVDVHMTCGHLARVTDAEFELALRWLAFERRRRRERANRIEAEPATTESTKEREGNG